MKVLIVEDEPLASERLRTLIHQYDAQWAVVDELDSVADAVQFLRANASPDLLFLDIQLSDGLSFEIFEQTTVLCPVIFTTAYDQYALQAFRVHGIDYLLKPIDAQELKEALDRARRWVPPKPDLLQQVHQQLTTTYQTRFLVKIGDHYRTQAVADIAYLYADGKVTYLVSSTDHRRYHLDYTLENLENHLLDPRQFFRINRKFMMSVEAIAEVRSYVNGRLKVIPTIPCEADMIVSRERVADFKAWLNL